MSIVEKTESRKSIETERDSASERALQQEDRTFSAWINIQLAKSQHDPPFQTETSLRGKDGALCDGTILHKLAKVLVKNPDIKFGRIFDSPKTQNQRINNLFLALEAFQKDGIILHSIGTDGSPIERGDETLTFGLIWQIIVSYQIAGGGFDTDESSSPGSPNKKPKTAAQAKQTVIQLFNKNLETLTTAEIAQIYSLSSDPTSPQPMVIESLDRAHLFHSGTVLAALAIGLADGDQERSEYMCYLKDWYQKGRKQDMNESLALTNAAINTAYDKKRIPIIIAPEDVVIDFNPRALLLYLSYFAQSFNKILHENTITPMTPHSESLPQPESPPPVGPQPVQEEPDEYPHWDELSFLLGENNDKTEHKESTTIRKAAVSLDTPSMLSLVSKADALDNIIKQFNSYCSKNGTFAKGSEQESLFDRLKTHRQRLALDLANYQHSFDRITAIQELLIQANQQNDELIESVERRARASACELNNLRNQLDKTNEECADAREVLVVKSCAIESLQSTVAKLEEDLVNSRQTYGTETDALQVEVKQLKKDLAKVESENASFQQQLMGQSALQSERESATKDQLDQLTKENEQMKEQITEKDQKLKETQLAFAEKEHDIDQIQRQLDSQSLSNADSNAIIQARLDEKEMTLKETNAELEQAQHHLTETEKALDDIQKTLHHAQSQATEANQRTNDAISQIDMLSKQIEALQDERDKLKENNEKLSLDLDSTKTRMSQIEDYNTDKSDENRVLGDKYDQLRQEHDDQKQELEQIKSDLVEKNKLFDEEQKKSKSLQKKLGDVQSTVAQSNQHATAADDEINSLGKQIENLQGEHDQLKKENEKLSRDLDNNKLRTSQIEDLNAIQSAEKDELREKFDKLLQDHENSLKQLADKEIGLSEMEQTLSDANSQLIARDAQLSLKNNELSQKDQQLQELQETNDSLRDKLDNAQSDAETQSEQHSNNINTEINNLHNQIEILEAEQSKLVEQNQRFSHDLGDNKVKIFQLEDQNTNQSAENKALKLELVQLQDQILKKDEDLEKEKKISEPFQKELKVVQSTAVLQSNQNATNADEKINQLYTQIKTLQDECDKLKESNEKLSQDRSDNSTRTFQIEVQNIRQLAEHTTLQNELDQSRKALAENTKEFTRKDKQLAEKEQQLVDQQKQNQQLQQQLDDAQSMISESNQCVNNAKAEINNLREQIEALEDERAEPKDHNDQLHIPTKVLEVEDKNIPQLDKDADTKEEFDQYREELFRKNKNEQRFDLQSNTMFLENTINITQSENDAANKFGDQIDQQKHSNEEQKILKPQPSTDEPTHLNFNGSSPTQERSHDWEDIARVLFNVALLGGVLTMFSRSSS